jgi:coenzyme F420 hydrogenase subunit beta
MLSYEDLESKIIDTGICTGCGACILACPTSHIGFIEEKPKRPGRTLDCVSCSTCYDACYMLRRGLMRDIEGSILGWGEKESIGIYKRILVARTREQDIEKACQDGGIVTSLLIYALTEGHIDGALVVARDGWMPIASIAKTKGEVISSAMTKYGTTPVLKELRSAVVDHGLSRVCVVGTPCHIQSIRYLQHRNLPLASSVKFTIGLFCRENYQYHCIEKKVRERGLNIKEIDKLIVSEGFDIYASGKKLSFPITEVKGCVPKHCLICEDFASELADISIGSDGSPEGWSTIIVRTEEGEDIFSGLERNKFIETKTVQNLNYIKEIAGRKREKGKQTRDIFELRGEGLGKKEIAVKLGTTEERVSHRLEGF